MSAKSSLVSVSSLFFSYNTVHVLENISFEIKDHDFMAIIGPNGSGKTTLIKVLLGFLQPTGGAVSMSISKDKIGYVPQRYTVDRNFPGTVREILSPYKKEIISQVGVSDLLEKRFTALSGGQQQRVLITLALQRNPTLLILDEPTAGVDIQAQTSFYALLKRLNRSGIAIVLVTHEVGVISSLVKKVLCINHKICCMGKPQEMPKLLQQMYGEHFIHHHHNHQHHNNQYQNNQLLDHKHLHDRQGHHNPGERHD